MLTIEEAIEKFLHDSLLERSKQTTETYSQGMRRFKEYLVSTKHSPARNVATLSVDDALDCAKWLGEERGIGKATLKTYLASISRFYAYLLREQLVDIPAAQIERMRETYHLYRKGGNRPLPKLPPDDAVIALIAAARQVQPQPKKPRLELARLRNIAMLEALRTTGMRVGELVGLKRNDLDYRNRAARVTGKGDKQRLVYFDDVAWNALQDYLKARNDGERGRALYQLPVFARHDRRVGKQTLPLTTDTVRQVFAALAREAQIDITLTPHSLRHAFATRVLETTGDLAMVQDMLGHSSPETTRIYAKVSSKKMREAHRAAFGYTRNDEDKEK